MQRIELQPSLDSSLDSRPERSRRHHDYYNPPYVPPLVVEPPRDPYVRRRPRSVERIHSDSKRSSSAYHHRYPRDDSPERAGRSRRLLEQYPVARSRSEHGYDADSQRSGSSHPRHHRHSHRGSPERASRRHDPADQVAKSCSKSEHAIEKAIGAGAKAAYRVRHDGGSWAGEKGLKVAGSAVAAATIDALLNNHEHGNPLQGVAVSLVEKVVLQHVMEAGSHSK